MKINTPFQIFLAGAMAVVLLTPSFAWSETDQELTLQDISKTEAARFYIAKQYPQALEAFLQLEAEHPSNLLVKRYIASLHDSMQHRELAIRKLQEVLAIDSRDWTSRQILGDIYTRQGDLDKAGKEYRKILEGNDPESSNYKFAKSKLDGIEKVRSAPKTEEGRQMAAQEFMRSLPAQQFAKGEYEKAADGFEGLLRIYPQDVLIHRFRGIAFLRLNRVPEAVVSFEEGLALAPDNAALHFYLGQAYAQTQNMEQARSEYQWIIKNDKGPYQARAQKALFETLRGEKPKESKKWTLTVNNGYDYDSNATYKPRDPEFRTAGDQNSSRFNTSAIGTYRFYQKKAWFFTADALYAQSLYSDFPNLQTYTWGSGVSALRVMNLFGKTSYLNVRDGFTHTFLKNKFFVLSHTFAPLLIVNTSNRTRVNLGYRFNVNAYENRGETPDLTNRNGISNGFSVSGTYYFDDAKKNYFTLGYDFDYDRTTGVNYIRWGNAGRMEFHWALPAKVEFNLSFRYKDSLYPKYGFGPPDRWDHQFTLTPSLSRVIYRDYLFLTGSYTYENTPARNNAFDYSKHVVGVQLSARL